MFDNRNQFLFVISNKNPNDAIRIVSIILLQGNDSPFFLQLAFLDLLLSRTNNFLRKLKNLYRCFKYIIHRNITKNTCVLSPTFLLHLFSIDIDTKTFKAK